MTGLLTRKRGGKANNSSMGLKAWLMINRIGRLINKASGTSTAYMGSWFRWNLSGLNRVLRMGTACLSMELSFP